MNPRIGSLCSGYEGLGMAVQSVLGGELAWVADDSPGASAILAHHWPTVPNLGDITAVDWTAVEPVDVLCAGFPCQDVSAAGLRAGMRDGNRSGLWSYVAEAIAALRPPLVYIENVRGLLSAGADCDLEPCPGCLGDEPDQPALRACGAVCGDLASLGFDAEWTTLPASAVGASHGRPRVFVLAWPRFVPSVALGVAPPDAEGDGRDERWTQPARLIGGPHAPVRCTATPAHTADNGFERGGYHGDGGPDLRTVVAGLASDTDVEPGQQRRLAASGQAPGGGGIRSSSTT